MSQLNSARLTHTTRLRPLCRAVQLALALGLATGSSTGMAAAVIPLSSLNGSTGFRLNGVAASDYSGRAVSTAGDINGDGLDDLIVGARLADPNGSGSGSSYVLFGHTGAFASTINFSSLDGSTGFRLDGVAAGDQSGRAVSAAGDINGDGLDDLIVGAYQADPNGSTSGSSYVVFGHTGAFNSTINLSSLNGSTGFRLNGVATGDRSGFAVSTAGDINGDGLDDLIVGAYQADPNGSSSGSSYVLFGHTGAFNSTINLSSLDGNTGFRLDGVAASDFSGIAASAAGDMNGDGLDDLIVSADRADPNGLNSGSSYVLFGHTGAFASTINLSSLNGNTGFRLDGVAADDRSGYDVSAAGDINGDGLDDLIVGAYLADPNGSGSGSSYVLFGHTGAFASTINLSSLDGSTGFRLDGVAANDRSGRAVSAAGDINGDGLDDLIVGADRADPIGSNSGSSYVLFGHTGAFASTIHLSSLNGNTGFRLNGVATFDYSGRVVSAAGDINDDGLDDLIVGADFADPNGSGSGSSYVVFGNIAPLVGGGPAALPAIAEDSMPAGTSIAVLAAPFYLDTQPLFGAGITTSAPISAAGAWEYRLDGLGAWAPVPTVGLSNTNALVLVVASELRFLPALDFFGAAPPLSIRLWDGTDNYAAGSGRNILASIGSLGGFSNDANLLQVTASITSVNDAPSTSPVVLAAIAEDSGARLITQAELLANASDIDGPGLTATALIIAAGNGGLIDNGDGTWSYTPAANDDSNVSFDYNVSDGSLATAGSATLDITPSNDTPATNPVVLAAIAEDSGARLITQAELLVNASDIDGPSLSATDLSIAAGNGGLVDNLNGTWSYTPATDDNTEVSFNYSVSDGSLAVAGSATLDITPVNDAPTTSPVVLTAIVEDSGARLITQAELLVNASDVEGPSLTATDLTIAAGNGGLVDNLNGTWSYTPAANDDTNVSFNYSVSDGSLATAGSATLDITPINDAPATNPVVLTAIAEDSGARLITQAQLLVNASDIDGPSLTATDLSIAAGNGGLVDNLNGTWSYTPATEDNTNVSFNYSVSDGSFTVAGSATLDITPVNDAPTTSPVVLTAIAEDSGARLITQAQLLANASDIDGPGLTATALIIAAGNGGLVNNGNGTWNYTPAANDDTNVSFNYSVSDGSLATAGSATLDITPVNDAPATNPVVLTAIAEDSGARLITQAQLLVNASDVDGPGLTASALTIAAGNGGLVNNGNGTWNYTPVANDDTNVSFNYSVSDGSLATAGSATLDITPINDAPTNSSVVLASIFENSGARLITQAQLLVNASDIDGPSLTASNLSIRSGNGNLVNNGNGTWNYTPAANDSSSVSFNYQISDSMALVKAKASLDIIPVLGWPHH